MQLYFDAAQPTTHLMIELRVVLLTWIGRQSVGKTMITINIIERSLMNPNGVQCAHKQQNRLAIDPQVAAVVGVKEEEEKVLEVKVLLEVLHLVAWRSLRKSSVNFNCSESVQCCCSQTASTPPAPSSGHLQNYTRQCKSVIMILIIMLIIEAL